MPEAWDIDGEIAPEDRVDPYTSMWEDPGPDWNFNTVFENDPNRHHNDLLTAFQPSSPIHSRTYSAFLPPSRPPPPPEEFVESLRHQQTRPYEPATHSEASYNMRPPSAPAYLSRNTTNAASRAGPSHPHLSHRSSLRGRDSSTNSATARYTDNWLDSTAITDRPRPLDFSETMFEQVTERSEEGIDVDLLVTDDEEDELQWINDPVTGGTDNTPIDLTDDASPSFVVSQPVPRPIDNQRKPSDSTSAQSRKRKRRTHSPAVPKREDEDTRGTKPVEHLDLTADSGDVTLAQTIAAQLQTEECTGPVGLGKRQCIICMERFTDATTTHCGHMYCHECLTQALLAGEKTSQRGVGSCPVCRKPVYRRGRKTNQIIPIAFMKRGAYRGKRAAQ